MFAPPGLHDLLALAGAISSAFAIICIKLLRSDHSPYSIFFAQSVVGFWLVSIPANLVPRSITLTDGLLLIAIGFSATVAQLLMTYSYRYLTATTGSLMEMTLPPLNVLLGILIFGKP